MRAKQAKFSKSIKSKALLFMEKIGGGPLTLAGILRSLHACDEVSQKDFAARLGISKQNLCDIEKSRKAVTPSRAAIFAIKLGYPPTAFIRIALQEELDRAGVKIHINSVDAA